LTYTIFKSKIEEKGKILKETQPFWGVDDICKPWILCTTYYPTRS
jgi:hypothetical protein